MARKVRRKKGNPKAAIPTYREEGVKAARPDTRPALIALLLVILLIGSALYFTAMVEEAPVVEYGVDAKLLTNNHNTEPGYDTDFVLIVENTGSITDTFDIGVKSNDGGFVITIEEGYESIILDKNKVKPIIINVKTSASATGLLYAHMQIISRGDASQTANIRLNVTTDYEFGREKSGEGPPNHVSEGDLISVHYAGILARNANLFDSSMEYVWDNYEYRKDGVSDSNKHTDTLGACLKNSAQDCPQSHGQMIAGFTEKTKTMYEGQTLSVRIPAKDAYGIDPSVSDLGGEDLIFEIVIISID
jgi:hypothetical protein